MQATPLVGYVFTEHALAEMGRRELSQELIAEVLAGPTQRFEDRSGRDVFQSLVSAGKPPRQYVVRVFVDVGRRPAEVVTAYRSSKIAKYWRRDL